MKKQKYLIVVAVLLLFFIADMVTSLSYLNDSIEERISNTIEKDTFSFVEFEDGYICIYFDEVGDDNCLHFAYLKKELFGETGFNLRALIADDYNYYLSNTNIEKCFTLPLNNFSEHTIYFSCCKNEYAYPVEVNGQEVELHEMEIKNGTETLRRSFWFYFGEDEVYPSVQSEKTGDGSLPSFGS